MNEETPGATQGALPLREGGIGGMSAANGTPTAISRQQVVAERPINTTTTMRLTQVAGGQYVLTTTSPHGQNVAVPALAQISPNCLAPGTRIISISPNNSSRQLQSTSPLRPSLANQSIVNVLTKSRSSNSNVRLQLFTQATGGSDSNSTTAMVLQASPSVVPLGHPRGVKRPLTTTATNVMAASTLGAVGAPTTPTEKKDSKLQRVLNHRIVRSKIVKEKYAEHLLESFYLENGGNILDLYQYAKRPKTQSYLNYLKEHAIDAISNATDSNSGTVLSIPQTNLGTPSATCISSLPGSSGSSTVELTSSVVSGNSSVNSNINNSAGAPVTSDVVSVGQSDVKTPVTPTNVSAVKQALSSVKRSTSTHSSHHNQQHHTTPTTTTTAASSTTPTATPPPTNQEQIVEKAKQEAYVVQRISDLQKEGLWSEKRLPKVQEMSRTKAHWDFLLEEMVWLAADFAQERKWKKAAAKKCARMVQKYFQDKALAAQKAEKAHEQHLKRIASFCAKEIKIFWNNVEKLVEYKQNTILEEKRKRALDQQLSFIVDQTEKYSQLLAEGMNKSSTVANTSSTPAIDAAPSVKSSSVSRANSDDEFDPDDHLSGSEDDEETIEQEEAALVVSAEQTKEEVAALQRESQMELDDLLEDDFLRDYLLNRDKIRLSESEQDSNEEDDVDTGRKRKYKKSKPNPSRKTGGDKKNNMTIENEAEEDEEMESLDNETMQTSPVSSVALSPAESSEDEDMETKQEDLMKSQDEDDLKQLVLEENKDESNKDKDDLINDAAKIAESIQPKGNTLSSTNVSTTVPFLLKYSLREYQHIGLDWLVTMYDRKLNGILADEMGLGKTIQTIALLAHLACEKENWGPHLIVVPTSVMLNWEMECKKWCPAFKILTYYGSQKERKMKRTGWTKPNAFHICITSYKLVIQDHQSFRRKKWKYLILDEAQNIKNFKSQRWQLLLNFQTERRLLLTGTPLQNNLMELWSLMHFLMPNVFQSHREFKEWFSNPVTGMIEGNSEYNEGIIKRLHKVLRPFLLRRLKSEVEKQMPKKYEHVVMCRLSKRQRFLYDDYMSRAKTRETLASGNLLSVINVLMQLRKVCNHPNLFEVRPTISPFQCENISLHIPSLVYSALEYDPFKHIDLQSMNLLLIMLEMHLGAYQCYRMRQSITKKPHITPRTSGALNQPPPPPCPPCKLSMKVRMRNDVAAENSTKNDRKTIDLTSMKTVTGAPASNMKVKVSGVQLVSQGVVKTIPVVNISQAGGATMAGGQIQVGTSTMLKTAGVDNKISASFAQLVQTSTGKHLLLTSNPNLTSNIPVTSTTPGGQKLTFLSKQPVSTVGGTTTGQQITKAYVKFQLTSVTTATTSTVVTTSNSTSTGVVKHENRVKTVNADFIGQLYSKQNSLDVRWATKCEDKVDGLPGEEDPKGERRRRYELMSRVNERRCSALPLYGRDFQNAIKIFEANSIHNWSGGYVHCLNALFGKHEEDNTKCLLNILYKPERRIQQLKDICDRFIFYVPAVKANEADLRVWHPPPSRYWSAKEEKHLIQRLFSKPATPLHPIASAMVTQFPGARLIQYDCGKLQTLDRLLRKMKTDSHRVLIFTQMTKMLDVLEAFLNFHGHIYLRLDGTTKVDQRQMLMERFNGDPRIFAFILSTRSGGVGVNLTGADTVIFYDSDWNPTMDAQAQDRCHRIGQTRDVHIYRLVSERTIEENILKKANQKRLLGDLAIEGGNFTTAYFKSTTIQDLFNVDQTQETAAERMSEIVGSRRLPAIEMGSAEQQSTAAPSAGEDKAAIGALENALAACEDDQDVLAAKTAKAEAVADLAEFDENIPLEDQEAKEKDPEISRAEQEINNIIEKLSPIERYAMNFIEQTESAWSAEQLAAAERQIEEQKREWEENQLAAMKEEEERRARELEEENDSLLTYPREDATNQVWVSDSTMEQMPMWCPPTPPEQNTDIYIDDATAFLYESTVMSETQLPPVYIKKEVATGGIKRTRHEAGLNVDQRRPLKIPRRDEITTIAPRSLFHSPAILKMRRDMKLQKYRGLARPGINVLPGKQPGVLPNQKPIIEQPLMHDWTISEDMAILKVIQVYQGLPLNLIVMSPGHTPNWDFVADYVNTVSIAYRSPKQCRQRYENHLMHREEGKLTTFDLNMRKKKNKSGSGQMQKFTVSTTKSGTTSLRPMRTAQLFTQDNNSTFMQTMSERYDILKPIANKRLPPATTRTVTNNPLLNKTKTTPVLIECGIDLEHPILPVEVLARKQERLAKEKKSNADQYAKQMMKNALTVQQQQANTASTSSSTGQGQIVVQTQQVNATPTVVIASSNSGSVGGHVIVTQAQSTIVSTVVTNTSVSTPATPQNSIRTQRIIASPLQTSTVVSVSGLSPAQLQAATQRLIVSAGGQQQVKAGTVTGGTTTAGVTSRQLNHAQLQMIRQASLKQQLRLHAGNIAGGVKGSTLTIGGQPAVVQFTQSQQPRTQFVRQQAGSGAGITVGGVNKVGTGTTRTVTDTEVAQLLKKQHQLQQQKLAAVAAAQHAAATSGGGQNSGTTTIHGLSPQALAQAMQQHQHGGGAQQVATLVKTVSNASGVSQTVTLPVSGVALATANSKTISQATLKTSSPQQLRQLQLQQQLLAQKKLAAGQKLSIAQVAGASGGKGNVQTQLIVGSKPLSTAMTVQQFQQVMRSPMNVSQGPVVLAKGPPKVIPVNTGQGGKQTIQVVTASSPALRPQNASTLAGALAGIKVQTASGSTPSQAILSQVSAALNQSIGVRQGSPVRIQTASGTPIVAVSVQSASQNMSGQTQQQQSNHDQVSRYLNKK